MMKLKIVFILLMLYNLVGYGQSSIAGLVLDEISNSPIKSVHLRSVSDNTIFYTDSIGRFELIHDGWYEISCVGYQSDTRMVLASTTNVVFLEPRVSIIDGVVVSSNHIPMNIQHAVTTIDLIKLDELNRDADVNLTSIMNKIPGVYMQSGTPNTNRIVIRGIGSRNLYGTAKIRAYFDDIPLTTGSGETSVEDLELGAIAKLEIIKGANASVYGAGLGGTIHLKSQKSYLDEKSVSSLMTIGAFGLIKGAINANVGNHKHSLRSIYSSTHMDGYRENNQYDRHTFTVNSNHFINDKNHISTIGSYIKLNAFIPSSINKDDYINNPSSAAYTWARSKGNEAIQKTLIGLSWNYKYRENIKFVSSIFSTYQMSKEDRPFNILEDNTIGLGVRSRVLGEYLISNNKLSYTIGGELFKDNYKYRTFGNLYKKYPEENRSVVGLLLSDLEEDRMYYNLFLELNYFLDKRTLFVLGVNSNQTSYTLQDYFIETNHIDQSGDYRFNHIVSPRIGISHQLLKNQYLYGNISHGFSPPSLAETLLPDGQINTSIKPASGWNYELGLRGDILGDRLHYNLAFFRLDIHDLLVARRAGDDQYVGINAGRTINDGIELNSDFTILKTDSIKWSSYISYTLSDFEFKDFVDDGNDYSGNKLTGVPSDVLNIGMNINIKSGFYGNVNYQYVGSMPMDDSNSLFSETYQLTNIKLGYQSALYKSLSLHLFTGVTNVFNEKYASQILINAKGFGGKAPRYYYPGNPRSFYGGVNLKYMIK